MGYDKITFNQLYSDVLNGCKHLIFKYGEDVLRYFINTKHDRTGNTLIHEALFLGDFYLIDTLLCFYPDLSIKNAHGNDATYVQENFVNNGNINRILEEYNQGRHRYESRFLDYFDSLGVYYDMYFMVKYGLVDLFMRSDRGNIEKYKNTPNRTFYIIDKIDKMTNSKDGFTFLHIAAENGKKEMIRLLVVIYRVDINVKDNYNRTPYDIAKENGNLDIAEYLDTTLV